MRISDGSSDVCSSDLALGGGYVIAIYNRLLGMGRRVDEAWSDIQVQMKRRYDLIPNLVETMKGFMTHERGTLDSLTQARAAAVASDGGPGQQAQAEPVLQGAWRDRKSTRLNSMHSYASSMPPSA